jgi:hypothetical protein
MRPELAGGASPPQSSQGITHEHGKGSEPQYRQDHQIDLQDPKENYRECVSDHVARPPLENIVSLHVPLGARRARESSSNASQLLNNAASLGRCQHHRQVETGVFSDAYYLGGHLLS